VQTGISHAVTLTPGYPMSTFTEYWRMWADLNRDGDFEDAGEMLFEGSGRGAVSGGSLVTAWMLNNCRYSTPTCRPRSR